MNFDLKWYEWVALILSYPFMMVYGIGLRYKYISMFVIVSALVSIGFWLGKVL